MRNYEARLERIEAALKPELEPERICVWVQEGETNDEAFAKYAAANGLGADAPLGIERTVIYVRWRSAAE